MDTIQWWVLGTGIVVVLALVGLGFEAMSTNPLFTVPKWVPKIFFALSIAVVAGESFYFWDMSIFVRIIAVISVIGLLVYLFWPLLKRKHIKNKPPNVIEIKPDLIARSENLTDTLTMMNRRVVELQDEKFSHTKPNYNQIEKAVPILLDRMGVVKQEDWPRYLRNLKSRIRRASPRRPTPRGSIRQRAVEWVKRRDSIRQAAVSVAKEAKAELLKSKGWTRKDGVIISDWIDEHHWGVQEIRDADQQWRTDFESISHYLKQDAKLRELITEHIEMSRLYNNGCLIDRYSQRLPQTSFLISLHEALVGSPISPVKAEIYLSEILAEIDKHLNQTKKEAAMPSILIVDGLPQCRWYGNRLGRSWRLLVKNTSSNEAEDCRGKLIAIASTIQGADKGLGSWPQNEYLSWNTGSESISIAPNDIMELEVANYEGYGTPLHLAYTKGEDFRRQHELKGLTRPIILIIGITCKTQSPIYAVCRFYWARRNDDNLELIKVTSITPNITQYQTQVLDNGGFQT